MVKELLLRKPVEGAKAAAEEAAIAQVKREKYII